MADNARIRGSDNVERAIATDELALLDGQDVTTAAPRVHIERFLAAFSEGDGAARTVSAAHPLPVTVTNAPAQPLTNAELRAADIPITGDVGLVDAMGAPYGATNRVPVELGAQISVSAQFASVVSTLNNLDTPLAAGATFQGAWEDVRDFAAISVAILTDQPSAINGAVIQFSEDATTVMRSVASTIPAGGGHFVLAPQARYFRVRYTNGATAQGAMRSEITFRFNAPSLVQQPLAAPITDANMAGVTKSHLAGRLPSGQWASIAANTDGTLKADPAAATEATLDELRDRFPLATALTDSIGNPTVTGVGAFQAVYNGTTWDRRRNATGVDGTAAAAALAGAGAVVIASDDGQGVAYTIGSAAKLGATSDGRRLLGTGLYGHTGAGWARLVTAEADPARAGTLAVAPSLHNGLGSLIRQASIAAAAADGGVTANQAALAGMVAVLSGGGPALIRTADADYATPSRILAVIQGFSDGGVFRRAVSPNGDAMVRDGIGAAGNMLFNGTTWDRARRAPNDDNAIAGTGVPASGTLVRSSSGWEYVKTPSFIGDNAEGRYMAASVPFIRNEFGNYARIDSPFADAKNAQNLLASGGMVFNGTNWDRMRSVRNDGAKDAMGGPGTQAVASVLLNASNGLSIPRDAGAVGDGNNGNGVAPAGNLVFSGTVWDRVRGYNAGVEGSAGAGVAAVGIVGKNGTDGTATPLYTSRGNNGGLTVERVLASGLHVMDGGVMRAMSGDVANGLDVDVTRLPAARLTDVPGAGAFDQHTARSLGDGIGGERFGATMPMLFNGTTWDRAPGTVAHGLDVDVTRLPVRSRVAASHIVIVEQDELEYWSEQGVGFGVSTGVVSLTGSTAQELAAFVNPVGSGIDAFLMVGEFGASQNALFQRLAGATITPNGGELGITPGNRNGDANASLCRMYTGGATPTYARTGGTVRKTAHIGGYDQYITQIKRVRVRPGVAFAWLMTGTSALGAGYSGSVFLEWYERPAT